MSKRKQVKEGFQHAAVAAKDKLMHVLASGIVGTDPLTEEEKQLLIDAESMTAEERAAILKEVGDDPYLHMP